MTFYKSFASPGVLALAAFACAGSLVQPALAANGTINIAGTLVDPAASDQSSQASRPQQSFVISWPAFTTASGTDVPAGSKVVSTDAWGNYNVDLYPNKGSKPAVLYSVVFRSGNSPTTAMLATQWWFFDGSESPYAPGKVYAPNVILGNRTDTLSAYSLGSAGH